MGTLRFALNFALIPIFCLIFSLKASAGESFRLWAELAPAQQAALAPIGDLWNDLPAQQQNRLLQMTRRFEQLSDIKKRTVHARLRSWVKLSREDRQQARYNYQKLIQMPSRKQVEVNKHWKAVQMSERIPVRPEVTTEPLAAENHP